MRVLLASALLLLGCTRCPEGLLREQGRCVLPADSRRLCCWREVYEGDEPLRAVWVAGEREAWAAGVGGVLLRWDGAAWEPTESPTHRSLYALWGSGPGDVWAAGAAGTLLHLTDGAWREVPSPTERSLYALWGSGPGDVWAAGAAGTLLHFDGTSWTAAQAPGAPALNALWGSGPGDVWAAGAAGSAAAMVHIGPGGLIPVPTPPAGNLLSLWGAGPQDLWAAGEDGALWRWDGTAWARRAPSVGRAVQSLWGSGPHDLWAVGGSSVTVDCRTRSQGDALHFDGTEWQVVHSWPRHLTAISGLGARVFAVTLDGAVLGYEPAPRQQRR